MATFKVEIYVEEEGSISSARLTVRADGGGSPSAVADSIVKLIDSPQGKHAIWPEHYPKPTESS